LKINHIVAIDVQTSINIAWGMLSNIKEQKNFMFHAFHYFDILITNNYMNCCILLFAFIIFHDLPVKKH